jgi:hypothetical protein
MEETAIKHNQNTITEYFEASMGLVANISIDARESGEHPHPVGEVYKFFKYILKTCDDKDYISDLGINLNSKMMLEYMDSALDMLKDNYSD